MSSFLLKTVHMNSHDIVQLVCCVLLLMACVERITMLNRMKERCNKCHSIKEPSPEQNSQSSNTSYHH